jgi:DNA-binding SARP family transcriptional activator/class 3 adenylate cyclase
MEFRILGPFEVVVDGAPVALGGAKQRALLAILLMHANDVVSVDRLIEDLWEEDPPATAENVIQTYVSRLRRAFEPVSTPGVERLVTRKPGYMLRVLPGELDSTRFEDLAEGGRRALERGDAKTAAAMLREGLALWHGEPLSDLAFDSFARRDIERLQESRLAVLEDRIEADLALGRGSELIGELESLVTGQPLRERLRGQLMFALYRAGRQAEALAAYQEARKALTEDLGIDPGPELQNLERAILRQDPELESRQRGVTTDSAASGPTATRELSGLPGAATEADGGDADHRQDAVVSSAGIAENALSGSVCSACGQENPHKARFCLTCASPLSGRAGELSEERKTVTILFCDLGGVSAPSDRDPEEARDALRPYHARLRREIERFGGTLEKSIGDAVMAVFGAPIAHEDDPERAVLAAVRILEDIEHLKSERGDEAIAAHIGINTGEAVVTLGARPPDGEGFVAGDVVNTASRLQSVAPVGAIVVGEQTYRSTRTVIEYEALEPATVKGKADALPMWRVLGARSRFGVDVQSRAATEFVGREDELEMIQRAFLRALREQSLQLVTVTGEPGVGKSRLVGEFFRFVDNRPEIVQWLQGRCLPYGDGITFWALGEIVKAYTGILDSDGPEEASAKIAAALEPLIESPEDRDWVARWLGALVGTGTTRDHERAEQSESSAAWRRFFESIAAETPLVMVVEDLHWADAALLAFLEELVDWTSGVPMVLVVTARPELYEVSPGWGGGKRNATTIGLAPLGDADTSRLIAAVLSQAVLPAVLQAALLERAGGNPLYAEEFARMLLDQDLLERKGRALVVRGDVELKLPDTLQALIAARLDTLSADHKAMLQDASVLGKVFWSGALATMGKRDPEDVRQGLHDLARRELIRSARQSSFGNQAEYSFWHALLRDVAYGQIPRQARANRHLAAALWIESVAGERVEDFAEILAHHYGEAHLLFRATGDETRAEELTPAVARFLLLAGDRALSLHTSRARRYYEEALALIADGDPVRSEVLVKIAMAADEEASRVPLLREAIEGFERAGNLQGAGDAMVRLAFALWYLTDPEYRTVSRAAIDLLENEPPGPALAHAYANLADVEILAGNPAAALEPVARALELTEQVEAPEFRAQALAYRGMARVLLGDPGGIEDQQEAIATALRAGIPHVTSSAYNNLADTLWLVQGPERAIEAYLEGVDYAQAHGLGLGLFMRAGMLQPLYEMGRWDDILGMSADLIERAQGSGAEYSLVVAESELAHVLLSRGAADAAAPIVTSVVDRSLQIQDLQMVNEALVLAAMQASAARDRAAVRTHLAAFLRETAAGPEHYRAIYLPEAVRLSLWAEDLPLARSLADSVIGAMRGSKLAARSAAALVAEAEERWKEAAAEQQSLGQDWREHGNVIEAAHSDFAAGRCLLSLDSPDSERFLERALESFSRVGAAPLVAEIRRLRDPPEVAVR